MLWQRDKSYVGQGQEGLGMSSNQKPCPERCQSLRPRVIGAPLGRVMLTKNNICCGLQNSGGAGDACVLELPAFLIQEPR